MCECTYNTYAYMCFRPKIFHVSFSQMNDQEYYTPITTALPNILAEMGDSNTEAICSNIDHMGKQ